MNNVSTFSIRVGELAYALRADLASVKNVAQTKSAFTKLQGERLDQTLQRLKDVKGLNLHGWDLNSLDAFDGDWVKSLHKLYSTPVAFPASMPPSQGIQIHELVKHERPKRVLEIGCFIGISSHWIASALEENGPNCVDSIDTFWPKPPTRFHYSYLSDPYRLATTLASETSVGRRIHFHSADSITWVSRLKSDELFDFIFIDGDHTFSGVTSDLLACFGHLKRGGAFLLHDVHPEHCGWTGPRRLIDDYLANSPGVSVTEIDTEPNFGMALVRKLRDDQLPFRVPYNLAMYLALCRLRRRVMAQLSVRNSWVACAAKTMLTVTRSKSRDKGDD